MKRDGEVHFACPTLSLPPCLHPQVLVQQNESKQLEAFFMKGLDFAATVHGVGSCFLSLGGLPVLCEGASQDCLLVSRV